MAVTFPRLPHSLRLALLWVALFVLLTAPLRASPLLLSTSDRPFGPSSGMGGVQVALAGSTDALWANPAGIARNTFSEGFFDAGALTLQDVTIGKLSDSTLDASPGGGGWVRGPTRERPRWGYAVGIHVPAWQNVNSSLDDTRLITGGQLPGSVTGSLSYSTLFPGGIHRQEFDTSSGDLQVVAPMAGVGYRVSDSLRVGAMLMLQRVSFRIQESFAQSFSAEDNTTTANVLAGSTQSSSAYHGEANRMVLSFGAQWELSSQIVLGATWRQPSQAIGGVGQVRVNRSDSLLVTQNRGTLQQATAVTHIDASDTAFELRSPGSLRLGVGFLMDTLVVSLDLEQVRAIPRYKVFPSLQATPPSTVASRQDPLSTQSNAVTRYSVTTALAQGNQASWFFGFSTDPSPVPANDPIFRKVDLYRFNTGYYVTRGPLAGAVRLGYTVAESPLVRFRHLSDEDGVTQSVRITQWTLGFSGSYVF